MRRTSAICLTLAIVLVATGSTMAGPGGRPDKSSNKWFTDLSIGAAVPMNDYSDLVDDGWYFKGGAMLWPEEWPVGLSFTAAYSDQDLSSDAISFINDQQPPGSGDITGGDIDIWSIESNVTWGPKTGGIVGFYVTGGIGVDFIDGQITSNGVVVYPPFCGWYWCVPGGVGSGTVINGSASTTEFSYNAGLGIDFKLNSGVKLYLEATYHSANTELSSTDYIPIVFGVRF